VSSVGGNVCTASPISDLNPLWIACGAEFELESLDAGTRRVPANEFFQGYRSTALKPDEVLRSVILPLTEKGEYVREFKQSHRREDDIAIVTAGMRCKFDIIDNVPHVADISFGFGGMSFKTVTCPKTRAALVGKPWTDDTLKLALKTLPEDLPMSPDVPGGMCEFRRSLANSFLFKFYVVCSRRLEADGLVSDAVTAAGLDRSDLSAADRFHRPFPTGAQYTQVQGGTTVGQPTMHQSAEVQVTGEAEYADDIAKPVNMLHAALVLSTVPHAKILEIDPGPALAVPGVQGFFSHQDVPNNVIGPAVLDEEVFASQYVTCVGHPVGIVVADTQDIALEASRLVRVKVRDASGDFKHRRSHRGRFVSHLAGVHGPRHRGRGRGRRHGRVRGGWADGDRRRSMRRPGTLLPRADGQPGVVRRQRRPHHHLVHAGAAEAPEAHLVRAEDTVQQGGVQDEEARRRLRG
jgi:xanthine dehydrogenase/oxidase